MSYVMIVTRSGILENVCIYDDREEALEEGRDQWDHEGDDQHRPLGDGAEGEEIDPEWGGVSRNFTMHWFDDKDDVWVVELKEEWTTT